MKGYGPPGMAVLPRKEWNFGRIYASEVAAKILLNRYPHLENRVTPLAMETEYQINGRKVVLIGANHCIGAVMFLFKSEKGIVLHTGDFRYRPQMLDKIKKFTGGKGVDYIHMDNTFATIGEHFPS
jgi:Cft2 family RNA processing exonuclease